MPDYPGLGLPLRDNAPYDVCFFPIGADSSCDGSISPLIFVRELAMLDIMEQLTDKDDWHMKVFDEEIVDNWRREALAIPDAEFWKLAVREKEADGSNDWGMRHRHSSDEDVEPESDCELEGIINENVFNLCVKELRCKARYYERTGIIPTLDVYSSVAKSDKLVSTKLHQAVCHAFDTLKADHEVSPDWHPNSNNMVQNLVHPSMYPLVYGRSRGFKDECVGLADAVDLWAGKGDFIPKNDSLRVAHDIYIPEDFWSSTYQWLPTNIAFRQDGSVQVMGYINNLHPSRYADIYKAIEDLITIALPLWDQCLIEGGVDDIDTEGAGRRTARIAEPDDANESNNENWIPSNPADCAGVELTKASMDEYRAYYDDDSDEDALNEYRWKQVRKPFIPEPSYDDIDYAPQEGKRLIDRFRNSGLQVIVKMASIELTPEKSEVPAGGWHVEGQMNERICATALYYLDSENITDTTLAFRMQTSQHIYDDLGLEQDGYGWMEQVYGTGFGGSRSPCLQNYGSVQTRQGRLLAFPNVFQHRVSSFKLIDPTKPGHRRFIALWLVDPHVRIISTANVPPQQLSWYRDSLLGSSPIARTEALSKLPPEIVALLLEKGLDFVDSSKDGRLPVELMEMVREYFEENKAELPMTIDEAREHRVNLMSERTKFQDSTEERWLGKAYNFCEH